MSRIGKKPIPIPSGVQVNVVDDIVKVKGPKTELTETIRGNVRVSVKDNSVVAERASDSREDRAFHGLMRTLVQNMIIGVSDGFKKELAITGVGYRANVSGSDIELHLGYSHSIKFPLPKGVSAEYDKKGNTLTLSGANKQILGLAAAKIRAFRGPEPYKGKGVRYATEKIRRKAGKAAGGK